MHFENTKPTYIFYVRNHFMATIFSVNGTVVQWLALSPHSEETLGLKPQASWSLSVWTVQILPVNALVLSR